MRNVCTGLLLFLLSAARPAETGAQVRTPTDWAWKPVITHQGLAVSYIFYSEADNENNGVVIRLVNHNDHPIRYRFTIIFRTEGDALEEEVTGRLETREVKTGSSAGLFWIPFPDGRSISEIGLKGYRVDSLNIREPATPG